MNVITEKQMAFMVVATLLNKFDFYVVIDGERGLGKSTVAIKLSKNVSEIFRKLYSGDMDIIMKVYKILLSENPKYTLEEFIKRIIYLKGRAAYQFRPSEHLIYDQQSAKEALEEWNSIGLFDEFVNIGYSRDFFDKGQKDLIKLINLNRDHTNLTIGCIPHFLTADNQLRNLCKLRIYVHKRGEAVILSPNRGVSIRDRWETDLNTKIESEWRKKGIKNPQWTRLTTFRAVMKTYPLSKAEEVVYQKIKNNKRANLIVKADEKMDPIKKAYQNVYNDLLSLKIKSYDELNGAAIGMGVTANTLSRNLKIMLKKNNEFDNLPDYFEEKVKQRQKTKLDRVKAEKKYDGMSSDEIIIASRNRMKDESQA